MGGGGIGCSSLEDGPQPRNLTMRQCVKARSLRRARTAANRLREVPTGRPLSAGTASASGEVMDRPTNAEVAAALERVSELLQAQGANPYRLEAYRAAGAAVRTCDRQLGEVLAERG